MYLDGYLMGPAIRVDPAAMAAPHDDQRPPVRFAAGAGGHRPCSGGQPMRRTLVFMFALGGCFRSIPGPTGDGGDGSVDDAIEYRDDLASHPGCTTAGLAYTAASIPGYPCAAKSYGAGDTDKSIVILVHGNSDTPDEFEKFEDGDPMIAETLVGDGHEVIAVDLRIDECDDPQANNDTEN